MHRHRKCMSALRSLKTPRFWICIFLLSTVLVILQTIVLKSSLRSGTIDEPMTRDVRATKNRDKAAKSNTYEQEDVAKQASEIVTTADGARHEAKLTTRRNDIAYSDRARALRHQLAMEKLLHLRKPRIFAERLFHIIETFNEQKSTKLMDLFDQLILDKWTFYKTNDTMDRHRWSTWEEDNEPPNHEINCTNIHQIRIGRRLGVGYIKVAYEGDFFGKKVVVKVKMISTKYPDFCGKNDFTCAVYRDIRILNELLILDHMDHPMFIRVLGYCIHSGLGSADFLQEPGVVGVYEMGRSLAQLMPTKMDWKQSVNQAFQFADFLNYVEHSPLGRLTLYDIKPPQFVYARSHICLSDVDLADNMPDPQCKDVQTQPVWTREGLGITACHFDHPFALRYSFDIRCIDGHCLNLGQKHNMMMLYEVFLKRLLYWRHYPEHMRNDMRTLSGLVHNYLPAAVLYDKLKALLDNFP